MRPLSPSFLQLFLHSGTPSNNDLQNKPKSVIRHSKIDTVLKTPSHSETIRQVVRSEPIYQQESHENELYSGSLGLFTPNLHPEQTEGYLDDFFEKEEKEETTKIRW